MIPFGCLGLIALALCAGARPAAAADDAWKAEWDKTLAAAKKEGKLVLYMRRYDAVLKEFSKKYPEIKPVVVTGEGPVLGTRIVTERRAEKYLVDLYVGGPYTVASTLLPAEAVDRIDDKLLLPEVLDTSSWVNHEIRYSDPERKYNLAFLANPGSSQISYNSTLVDPKTITSYQDFLDPKWKGKIVSIDPTDRHIGGITQFIYYNPNLGPDFFRKLFGEMDVTYARNVRQMTDWLAAGKFALCLGCLYIERAKQQGLPVGNLDTTVYKEGASFQAGSGSISLIKQAPNPNAAKLFINWLLSREGQMVVQKTADNGEHMNSGRIDIPKDDVDRDNQLVEGEQYFDQNSPEWADIDKVDALSRQIMATKSMQ
jgi:ABC-type glycerol-3-phosphate transport system substrate-binding protein